MQKREIAINELKELKSELEDKIESYNDVFRFRSDMIKSHPFSAFLCSSILLPMCIICVIKKAIAEGKLKDINEDLSIYVDNEESIDNNSQNIINENKEQNITKQIKERQIVKVKCIRKCCKNRRR